MSTTATSTYKRSLAGRLTRWIMFTVFLIMTFVTILIYMMAMGAMAIQAEERSQGMMTKTNESINAVLNTVEVAIVNIVPEIEERLDTPDELYDIVERILRLNPDIVGSAIAFEPNYFPDKGVFFSPYAYRKDSINIITKQLGTVDYEYHYMDWYQIPKLLGKPYWTDPYYDTGGGEMTMATYSLPLFNSNGEMYAVVTADISLDWLTEQLHEIDKVNNNATDDVTWDDMETYSFIISRNGSYIVHPDKEHVLNQTFFSYAQETKDTIDDHIGYEMITGKQGYEQFNNDGTESYIFYKPIRRTGWSMAIIIPNNTMYHDAYVLGGIIIFLMIVGLIILFFVCRTTIRRITRPLRLFADSADEIAKGNFQTELPIIKSKDEMYQLRTSFQQMQTSLIRQIEETKTVNETKGRMESELQIARNIQMSMLPKIFPPFPDRDDIDIFARLTPAKEVGGDLYDFFIRDEKLFFCVGDVSGKGIPASLVMAVTRSLFRTVSVHESNPAKIVGHINDNIAEDNDLNIFVTFWVGVLDLPTGRLRYCNAGHCAPLLIGSGMGELPIIPNIPLGIMQGYKFEVQEATVCRGTTIFLYTDGLTEATNSHDELFDDYRMLATAQQMYSDNHYKPMMVVDTMEQAVKQFVGDAEQSDDLTMMAIQYLKEQKNIRMQHSITLINDIEQVPLLADFVDMVCEEVGFDPSVAIQMNLAIEEAVVNVMTYAYPGTTGNVNIEAQANDERLKFTIIDSGIPFDPTAKAEVDTTLSAEERPIGGLGIHLVRQLMDSINYERVDGKNVLTLRKKFDKPPVIQG
jgi:sigma-B regulation protein RsbU (phosphoserine phosphatase)